MADIEAELAQLEIERKHLELEKLRAEIDEVSLAWWKRPGYLAGLTPIALALVGVGTAWVTGFFDTKRQELAQEITALEQEKLTLEQSIEQTQLAIDLGYLQARLAAEDASYALGHFHAFSAEFGGAIDRLLKYESSLPVELVAVLNQLLETSAERFNIVRITETSIKETLDRLQEIEASAWAKELTTNPYLSSKGLLVAQDGKVFDIAKARFLTSEEAEAAQR
ncbi:hypothetical protein [Ruegeria lacuscaerulensis]|uniref:hypothetical protein n=1 Tax=Ruegeria lacuscaerulensis TaxID=55218 RepID=UPI001480A511|nr:hypothetical protein [Ruegeria lacuscaerulensis]